MKPKEGQEKSVEEHRAECEENGGVFCQQCVEQFGAHTACHSVDITDHADH